MYTTSTGTAGSFTSSTTTTSGRIGRRRIFDMFARIDDHGRCVHCLPKQIQTFKGNDGKVIFDTEADAAEAAAMLAEMHGEAMEPYACPRAGKDRHFHLTTKVGPGPRIGQQRTVR